MASYCMNWVNVVTSVGTVPVAYFQSGVTATSSGCASGFIVLDNTAYVQLQTIATTQAPPVTITWPDLFNLSPADGATLSVAILAVWISAWKFKTLWRSLNPDGDKE